MVQNVLSEITRQKPEPKKKAKGNKMKKLWRNKGKKIGKSMVIAACAMVFFLTQKNVCFAETTGKVIAETANLRQATDVNSTVVGSTARGAKITLTKKVTDASGTTWYEVVVNANTKGYIRADLVEVDSSAANLPTENAQSSAGNEEAANNEVAASETSQTSSTGAANQPETGMEAQYATVSVEKAKIRSGASTENGVVDNIPQNTSVIVSGQSDDPSNGKTWYYVTFTGTDGTEKTGYIRSDLVQLGDVVPVEETQETEEPQEEEAVTEEPAENKDYEVVYTTNENGEYEWYLYNNLEGNRQKLEEVLAAAHAQSINDSLDAATVAKQRIVIIIMIAVIIVLAVAMTIMIFKLRDAYYEDYEDDEEDEDEEDEEEPVRRAPRRVVVEQEEPRVQTRTAPKAAPKATQKPAQTAPREEEPVRRAQAQMERQAVRKNVSQTDKMIPKKEVTYEEEPAVEVPVKTAPKRKAKNFLIDDDDFEFEFLNMNDKD